ncbi:MAG: diguanylate cyclase [Acidimicrobiia bacterium]
MVLVLGQSHAVQLSSVLAMLAAAVLAVYPGLVVRWNGRRAAIDLTDAVFAVSLATLGTRWSVAVSAFAGLLSIMRRRSLGMRSEPVVVAANIAVLATSLVGGAWVFSLVAGGTQFDVARMRSLVSLLAAAIVARVASGCGVHAFAALLRPVSADGERTGPGLGVEIAVSAVMAFVAADLAALVLVVAHYQRSALVLMAAPIALSVSASYQVATARGLDGGVEFLRITTRRIAGPAEPDAIQLILDSCLDHFRAANAELIVLPRTDGDVATRRTRSAGGREVTGAVASYATDELRAAIGGYRTAVVDRSNPRLAPFLERRGYARVLVASVPGDREPAGLLLVADRGLGHDDFDIAERRLLETIANQVAVSLRAERLSTTVRELAAEEEALRHQARHDSLTGLGNRVLLDEQLQSALGRLSGDVALLFVDLDGFKEVNDSFGHAAGDVVLRAAAERLRAATRPGDTLVRLGGDEFAVLISGAGSDQALVLADRLLDDLQRPLDVDGVAVRVGASVGIALRGDTPVSPSVLIQRADKAMYEAKRRGKGRYAFYDPSQPEFDDRSAIDVREPATGGWSAPSTATPPAAGLPVPDALRRQR